MTDDKQIKIPVDGTKIDINEAYELRYWAIRFGCTTDELWDAVATVGVQVEDVAEYLDMPGLADPILH